MKGAVIYARYSCEKQNDQSIESQLRICRDFAEKNGLTIVGTYADRATTGTNDNRAEFQRMLSDAEKPSLWDIVLVYAIDRFGRNSIEIALNKQRLKNNHKTLISATQRTSENIDGTRNLDGILLENVYIGLAEYYSAELSQKIRRGNQDSRAKGLFTGGVLPYGYKCKDKKVYIDEGEADIVRSIYQNYLSGTVVKEIIGNLHAAGITFHGKPFRLDTVYHMLRMEKYIGVCHYAGVEYTNIFPAIVPKQLYDDVQKILRYNKKGKGSVRVQFLLKGKCICGLCGTNLQGDSGTSQNGSTSYYYKCMKRKREGTCNKTTLPKEKFEKFIVDITYQTFASPEVIGGIADEIIKIHEAHKQQDSVRSLLQNEAAATQRTLDNIMKAIEKGIFNDTTQKRMEELETRLQEIEVNLALCSVAEKERLTKEQVVQYLQDSTTQGAKKLVRSLIEKIVVYNEKVEIYYKYTERPQRNSPSTLISSDREDMPGKAGTNPNNEKKNYPKSSDSSDLVDLRRIELRSYKVPPRILHA